MDPFTNEPYNFNDTRNADPRETEFNNGIREITVSAPNSRIQLISSQRLLSHLNIRAQIEPLFAISFSLD